MDCNARPGRARAEQREPPRGKGVFLVVGILAHAIKNVLLALPGANSCCAERVSKRRSLPNSRFLSYLFGHAVTTSK